MLDPDAISSAERQARFELAVVCRISDYLKLSDHCGGFTAARIADSTDLLIRGHRQHPRLVTAANLFKRGINETPVMAKNIVVNGGALGMAQAIFKARTDVNVILHGHTPASMVFSALDTEILPIGQFGVMYYKKVNKMPFGDVNTVDWCRSIVEALAGNPALIFANHGIVVVGKDAKQALHNFYAIEQAMSVQIAAMQTGAAITVLPHDIALREQKDYWGGEETADYDGTREWSAWINMAYRLDPTFAEL
jgi:ribulose-5-phosphate 4-epimerase/fuculose-1-phosphate aldolase